MQIDNDIEMPEAVAYIAAADLPLLKHGIAPISAEPTTPDDIALHTADQLRAAVLRERERWQADAERYRWLRDKANDVQQRAPMAVMVDSNFSISWRDALYGASLDAAIDAARKEHP